MKYKNKINKLLDIKYLLIEEIDKWELRKFVNSKFELIMSSDTHTEEELLEYAKKRHEINWAIANSQLRFVILGVCLIWSILNLVYFNSVIIRTIILTIDVTLLISMAFENIIFNKNHKATILGLKEDKKIIEKQIADTMERLLKEENK